MFPLVTVMRFITAVTKEMEVRFITDGSVVSGDTCLLRLKQQPSIDRLSVLWSRFY